MENSENKSSARIVVACLAVATLALMGVAIAAEREAPTPADDTPDVAAAPAETTITGVIEIADKNLLGDISALRVVSAEESFQIASDQMSEELEAHVGKSVTVTGEQTTDDEGNIVLSVRRYELVEG